MTTTPNMSLVLPTPGGDIGTWDDELNAALTLVDGHDHTSGKGPRVPVSGLNINADLSLASHSLTNIFSADFALVAAPSSGARRIFWNTADNEMYIRTNAGVNIKVTSGAGLNLAAIGGIVGDYGSIGAEVAYDDANDRYTFKQQTAASVRQWARLDASDLDIYEYKAAGVGVVPSNRVRLSSPAALAASYAMLFPAALPASQVALQVDNAGQMFASNTFPQAVTLTGGIANNVSLANGATLASGKTLDTTAGTISAGAVNATTFTASTDYKHSFTHKLGLPAALWQVQGSPAVFTIDGKSIAISTHTGGTTVPTANVGIPLKANDVITDVFFFVDKLSGAGTLRGRIKSYNALTGVTTDIANAAWPGAGNTISITGLSTTVIENVAYWIQIEGGGTTGDVLYHASVRYTR